MDYLDQLYAVLLDCARSGSRAGGEDGKVLDFLPSLRALSNEAPVVKPLCNALEAYLQRGQDDTSLLDCAALLRRMQLALSAAAAPPKDYTPLPSQTAPSHILPYRRLEGLRVMLSGGVDSETLRCAVEDGSARDIRLLPHWLDALEHRSLRSLAVRVFTGWNGYGRPALLSRMESFSAEAGRAVLDIAAGTFPTAEKLAFLRSYAARDGELRSHALLLLGKNSNELSDTLLLTDCLNRQAERDAALEALSRQTNPEAGQSLLHDAEACLQAQDFPRLQTVLDHITSRDDPANRQRYYIFYKKLLPMLICRPGNHIWLVQTCIDALAECGQDGIEFLEEMLTLAESKAS